MGTEEKSLSRVGFASVDGAFLRLPVGRGLVKWFVFSRDDVTLRASSSYDDRSAFGGVIGELSLSKRKPPPSLQPGHHCHLVTVACANPSVAEDRGP